MEDERESASARGGGESCECLKWNVIRASERRRAASEQKALAHLLGRPRSLRGHRDRTCGGANETIYCVKLAVAARTERRSRENEGAGKAKGRERRISLHWGSVGPRMPRRRRANTAVKSNRWRWL